MGKRVLRTTLCDMLGIEYPILSAGMGPTLIGEKTGAPVERVIAVSEAGGACHGMRGCLGRNTLIFSPADCRKASSSNNAKSD